MLNVTGCRLLVANQPATFNLQPAPPAPRQSVGLRRRRAELHGLVQAGTIQMIPGGTANLAVLGGNLPPRSGLQDHRTEWSNTTGRPLSGESPARMGQWPVPPQLTTESLRLSRAKPLRCQPRPARRRRQDQNLNKPSAATNSPNASRAAEPKRTRSSVAVAQFKRSRNRHGQIVSQIPATTKT
jgi:hypothetical protein